MKILTSWDDGSKHDLRIAHLLRKYKLPGIFFLPNVGLELSIDEIEELSHSFDIGGHTTSHPADLKVFSDEQVKQDNEVNKLWLEDIVGKELEWFCYPRGRYNEIIIGIVKDLGFKYARTTLVGNFAKCENQFRIHPTVHVHSNRKEYGKTSWLNFALEYYKLAQNEENSYYHIWGHSWEIEEQELWLDLEKLFIYIHGDQDKRSDDNTSET